MAIYDPEKFQTPPEESPLFRPLNTGPLTDEEKLRLSQENPLDAQPDSISGAPPPPQDIQLPNVAPAPTPSLKLMGYLKAAQAAPTEAPNDAFSDEAMKKAITERNQLMGTDSALKSAAQLGAGIAGLGAREVLKTPETTDYYSNQAKTKLSDLAQRRDAAKDKQQQKILESKVADIPLNRQILEQEFTAARQNGILNDAKIKEIKDSLDPNSPTSKSLRKLYENAFGEYNNNIDNWDQTPAYDLTNYMTNPLKIIENSKIRQQQQDQKQQVTADKRFDEANKRISAETASSRSTLGRNQAVLNGAEKIEAMVAGRNPNDLNSREIYELAKSLDGMLAVGMPSVTGVQKLIPKTSSGDLAKIQEYVTNKVQGAGGASFVKQMLSTVGREKQVASDQLVRGKKQILSSYQDLAKVNPEKWNNMMTMHGISEAPAAANKPKTVKQNGHTYTLNEETGEYE